MQSDNFHRSNIQRVWQGTALFEMTLVELKSWRNWCLEIGLSVVGIYHWKSLWRVYKLLIPIWPNGENGESIHLKTRLIVQFHFRIWLWRDFLKSSPSISIEHLVDLIWWRSFEKVFHDSFQFRLQRIKIMILIKKWEYSHQSNIWYVDFFMLFDGSNGMLLKFPKLGLQLPWFSRFFWV